MAGLLQLEWKAHTEKKILIFRQSQLSTCDCRKNEFQIERMTKTYAHTPIPPQLVHLTASLDKRMHILCSHTEAIPGGIVNFHCGWTHCPTSLLLLYNASPGHQAKTPQYKQH